MTSFNEESGFVWDDDDDDDDDDAFNTKSLLQLKSE